MNRIVRHHYPVERLPEDLRAGLSGTVTVMVEEEGRAEPQGQGETPAPPTIAELRALLQAARQAPPIGDDAVRRIRDLRDEWDA